MKFLACFASLTLLPLVLANPIAEPREVSEWTGPVPFNGGSSLEKRESCKVTGAGGLNGSGTCKYNNISDCPYVSVTGFCSGGDNFQCCRKIACTGKYSDWTCRNTYKPCADGGKFVSGYCPGPDNVKCCVPA